MNHFRSLSLLFSILFLTQNIYCQENEDPRKFDRVKLGDVCPQFTLNALSKENSVTTKNLKGSVTLINFFATWCGPCLKELPEVQKKIWEKYKDNKDFKLIVIGRGHGDKTVENFKTKNGFGFSIYADSTKAVYELFADKYIPRNYIIDKKGVIVYSGINYTEYEFEEILKKLEELLK